MKTSRASHAGKVAEARRKHRSRSLPKWLKSSSELEAVARARCLMLLSVLSGEMPVTDAIARAKISRGTYYQLETRALKAMLAAMNPLARGAKEGSADLSAASARIGQLQAQVKRLEQEKRRSQRLLLLTRKAMMRAPLTTGRRGPRAKAHTPLVSIPTSPGASSP